MNRVAGAVLLVSALVIGGGAAGAQEPWENIWFKVPVDANGAVRTSALLGIAHAICQGLGGRHYRSGSSRLGLTVHNLQAEHGLDREVVAACTAERESAAKK